MEGEHGTHGDGAQRYREKITKFAATYAPFDDGHASERVLDTLFPGPARQNQPPANG